jgi:hypothetical protein
MRMSTNTGQIKVGSVVGSHGKAAINSGDYSVPVTPGVKNAK